MTERPHSTSLVCAVDGDTPPDALWFAAELARGLGTRLVLAHVLDPADADPHPGHRRANRAEQDRAFGIVHRAVRMLPPGTAAHERVLLGTGLQSLLDLTQRERAELIVVGSRGLGPLASALMGSFSRELVRRATCSVAVVPPGPTAGRPGAVVCGIDASQRATGVGRRAASLSRRLGDRLLIAHSREQPYAGGRAPLAFHPSEAHTAEALVTRVAAAVSGAPDTLLLEGEPAHELEALANRERARMIVVGSRGLGNLRSILLGSVSSELMRIARRPVVILPDAALSARVAA